MTVPWARRMRSTFNFFVYVRERGLNERIKRNAEFEMSALELFWGKPNGQFFTLGSGAPE